MSLGLVMVDPRLLRVADQIRFDATPDEQLVESVRSVGILQPPVVKPNQDGEGFTIVYGHRRVGAAIVAGLDEIPVLVRDRVASDGAVSLEQQIVENERRKGVSARELAVGYASLEGLFGLTPEQIAAATGEKPERVRAGIKAASSANVVELLSNAPMLDLEQAAVLTEFEEHKAARDYLAKIAVEKPADFDYHVRTQRDKIALKAREAELGAEIKSMGLPATKVEWGYPKTPAKQLEWITNPETGEKFTTEEHAGCPGHSAYVRGYNLETVTIAYACLDANGYHSAQPVREEPTEEELKARAEAEARELAIAANRTARREWIRGLLAGKVDRLSGLFDYLAAAYVGELAEQSRPGELTLELLGIENTDENVYDEAVIAELVDKKQIPAARVLLAGAFDVHEEGRPWHPPEVTIRHLKQLEKWGYPLSTIDREILTAAEERLAELQARQAELAALEADDDPDDNDEETEE